MIRKNDKMKGKRERKVAGFIKRILKISVIALFVPGLVFGAQQPNPRSTTNSRDATRSADSESNASVRRSATSVIARSAAQGKRQNSTVVTARPSTARSASVRSGRSAIKGATVTRNASRAALVRSGAKQNTGGVNVSRAGTARATAVFNDVSKISGGYAGCRDSYATCMDQLCANANDTYRRCFCSDRFVAFRDTSDKLDEAVKLLAEFQNVNLDAVNKTAAEVNAMYTATEGEEAIKRDTSASQKLLDSIGDLLSGKTSKYQPKQTAAMSSSLGVLDFSSFSSNDDVFGESSSVFGSSSVLRGGSSSYTDISKLEGTELYNAAVQQCSQITRESCSGDALFNLARSAYSILVTQDCNAYEKNINAKKASLEDTIRTAEKYLREARLNEYRAHNSLDVSECMSKVEEAIRQPNACGANYGWCLDYTGLYIKPATGEPIYSQALFGLNTLIQLDGTADVLGQNPDFNRFLEGKKVFAQSALDTCRGIADTVWEEFKRMALIQIAQAQSDKIEEVKSECVNIMKECYDKQTGALNSFSEDTAKSATRAISAVVAHDMCSDQVMACAALYGDTDGCRYNASTKKVEASGTGKTCGLQSLLAMVDAVDTVRASKGCEESLREYVADICAPTSSDTAHTYPWGCRLRSVGNYDSTTDTDTLYALLKSRASDFCNVDSLTRSQNQSGRSTNDSAISVDTENIIKKIVEEVKTDLYVMLADECEDMGGYWDTDTNCGDDASNCRTLTSFYTRVFGNANYVTSANSQVEYTKCKENTVMAQCLLIGAEKGYKTSFNSTTNTCILPDKWYQDRCVSIGGYYDEDEEICYVPEE